MGLIEGVRLFQKYYGREGTNIRDKFMKNLKALNEFKKDLQNKGPIFCLKKYFQKTWAKFKGWIPTKPNGKFDHRKIAEYIVKYQLGSWRDYNFIKYIIGL